MRLGVRSRGAKGGRLLYARNFDGHLPEVAGGALSAHVSAEAAFMCDIFVLSDRKDLKNCDQF